MNHRSSVGEWHGYSAANSGSFPCNTLRIPAPPPPRRDSCAGTPGHTPQGSSPLRRRRRAPRGFSWQTPASARSPPGCARPRPRSPQAPRARPPRRGPWARPAPERTLLRCAARPPIPPRLSEIAVSAGLVSLKAWGGWFAGQPVLTVRSCLREREHADHTATSGKAAGPGEARESALRTKGGWPRSVAHGCAARSAALLHGPAAFRTTEFDLALAAVFPHIAGLPEIGVVLLRLDGGLIAIGTGLLGGLLGGRFHIKNLSPTGPRARPSVPKAGRILLSFAECGERPLA